MVGEVWEPTVVGIRLLDWELYLVVMMLKFFFRTLKLLWKLDFFFLFCNLSTGSDKYAFCIFVLVVFTISFVSFECPWASINCQSMSF